MRYYSTERPVMPGTFPKAGNKVIEIENFDERREISSIGKMAWGYIEYENPLAEDVAAAYELVAEPEQTAGLEDEAVYRLENDDYLYIQTCDAGYDYTIYSPYFTEIDGGQMQYGSMPITKVRDLILALHERDGENIETVSVSEFHDAVAAKEDPHLHPENFWHNTIYGPMRQEDYLDMVAEQYGYKSYEDLCRGVREEMEMEIEEEKEQEIELYAENRIPYEEEME